MVFIDRQPFFSYFLSISFYSNLQLLFLFFVSLNTTCSSTKLTAEFREDLLFV